MATYAPIPGTYITVDELQDLSNRTQPGVNSDSQGQSDDSSWYDAAKKAAANALRDVGGLIKEGIEGAGAAAGNAAANAVRPAVETFSPIFFVAIAAIVIILTSRTGPIQARISR